MYNIELLRPCFKDEPVECALLLLIDYLHTLFCMLSLPHKHRKAASINLLCYCPWPLAECFANVELSLVDTAYLLSSGS